MEVSVEKDLGVTFDQQLSFGTNASKVVAAANSRLGLINRYFRHIETKPLIHTVSPTAFIHRTARSSITVISSLFGLSPKCRQFVIMWPRSHVAAPHTQVSLSR